MGRVAGALQDWLVTDDVVASSAQTMEDTLHYLDSRYGGMHQFPPHPTIIHTSFWPGSPHWQSSKRFRCRQLQNLTPMLVSGKLAYVHMFRFSYLAV